MNGSFRHGTEYLLYKDDWIIEQDDRYDEHDEVILLMEKRLLDEQK